MLRNLTKSLVSSPLLRRLGSKSSLPYLLILSLDLIPPLAIGWILGWILDFIGKKKKKKKKKKTFNSETILIIDPIYG